MAWAPPGVSEKDLRPTSASSLARRRGGGALGGPVRHVPSPSHTRIKAAPERAGFCQKTGPNVTFPPTRVRLALGSPECHICFCAQRPSPPRPSHIRGWLSHTSPMHPSSLGTGLLAAQSRTLCLLGVPKQRKEVGVG